VFYVLFVIFGKTHPKIIVAYYLQSGRSGLAGTRLNEVRDILGSNPTAVSL